jgi:hypothetical protein
MVISPLLGRIWADAAGTLPALPERMIYRIEVDPRTAEDTVRVTIKIAPGRTGHLTLDAASAKKLGQVLILCADAKLPEAIIEAHLQRDDPGGVEPDLFGS